MPTKSRALCADWFGAWRRRDHFVRSSRRIAEQILRKAPQTTPAAATTSPIVMRAAMVGLQVLQRRVATAPEQSLGWADYSRWLIGLV
jgi:hypothetical protein